MEENLDQVKGNIGNSTKEIVGGAASQATDAANQLKGSADAALGQATDAANQLKDSADAALGQATGLIDQAKELIGLIGGFVVPKLPPLRLPPQKKPELPKKFKKSTEPEPVETEPNTEPQPTTEGTTVASAPEITNGSIGDIPPEYRRVIGGVAFNEATSQGRVFYGRDAGFGQIQVYAVDNTTKKVVGPFRTSGGGVIFS